MRVALVHSEHTFVAMVIEAVLFSQSHEKAWQFIVSLLERSNSPNQFDDIIDLVQQVSLNAERLLEALKSNKVELTVNSHVSFSRRVLSVNSGQAAILSNGRVS